MKKFMRIVNRINESMLWVVGTLILIMGILLAYAIVMRYFFEKPPVWSADLTSWFTGLAAFLGGGYALLKEAHVKVDIFYEKFSLRIRSCIDLLTFILIFLIVIVFLWKGIDQVITNYEANRIASSGLKMHIWIKWIMMPLGALLLGLQAIVNLINNIYTIVKGERLLEEES